LASFVLFILIEAWLVRFVFNAADGHICRAPVYSIPGGGWAFLIAEHPGYLSCMFIDFFESPSS
jgi:TRAP-type mannitol/chloroaromatic compound transport system permease large subunit